MGLERFLPPLPLFLLQPVLNRIVSQVTAEYPSLFNRLGPHKTSRYVVDVKGFPFLLWLKPDPQAPIFRAVPRNAEPESDARIAGRFFNLLGLVDGSQDGDALFFSRDLEISGNTEAVVCLRNALDDVDGSIAASVADMFGPVGRSILASLRRRNQITKTGVGVQA